MQNTIKFIRYFLISLVASGFFIISNSNVTNASTVNINGQNPGPVTEAWQPDVRFFGIDPRVSDTGYLMYGDASWETPVADYTKSTKRFDATQYGGYSGQYGMAVDGDGNAMYVYGRYDQNTWKQVFTILLLKAGSNTPQVIWSGDFGWDYPSSETWGFDYDTNAISVNSEGRFRLSLTKNYDGAEIVLGTAAQPEFRKISPELINANISGANATILWNLSHDGRYALYGVGNFGQNGARIADLVTKTYVDVTSEIIPGSWYVDTTGFGKDGSLWFIQKPDGPYSQEWFVKRIAPNSSTAQTVTSISNTSSAFTQFIKVFPDAGTSGKVMYPKTISQNWGMDSDTKRTLAIKDASTGNEVTFSFDYDLMDGYFYILGRYPKNIEGQKMIPFNIHPNWSDGYLGFIDIDNPAGANGIRFLKWYNHTLDGTPLPYNEGQGIGPWYWHNNSPSLPINLHQQVQSPGLDPQDINPGEKIGKYQSGPGIIFSVDSDQSEATKLVVAIYKIGDEMPKIFFNKTSSSATKSMTIPYSYLGAGDYFWRARLETDDGGASDWVDFRYNPGEADYSLFEGFEPYPYGYRFYNNVPDPKILGGGVGYHIDTVSPYYHMDYIPGNKWDIFDRAFDTSPGSGFEPGSLKALLAFETLGLNNNEAFQGGNCYGMSTSAIMQYTHPDFLKSYFPRFSDLIGLGNIWDKIYSPSSTSAGAWDIYNDTLDTILTLQLGQYSSVQREAMENALHDPQKIMDELRKNPTKAYLLLLEGEDINGNEVGHAVVPYKVEGNKIYIWDNNVQYPRNGPDKAYDQYVEIRTDGTFYSPLYNLANLAIYKWKKITRLDLVNSDTIYNGGRKSVPAGFVGIKFLYTLSGKSDLLISDSEGRLSGFSGGTILEEIPGVDVITPYNATFGGTIENTRKQIYIPEKIDGLSIKVVGRNQENYNLMIAGGDYYTKVSGVSTNSGQTDTFASTNTGLTINFDDSKTGEYSLFAANFQDTLTGIVFLSGITSIPQSQEYSIDWSKVIQNSNDSISYQIDTDNDGMYDISSNFSSVLKSLNEKGSISGYVKGDTNASMAGWKVFIDLNGDGVLQEKKEPFQVTDNKGYYKFGNLDKGIFNIIEIPHQNWNLIKPVSKKYSINLNNGQNIVNLNFENSFSKGKSK